VPSGHSERWIAAVSSRGVTRGAIVAEEAVALEDPARIADAETAEKRNAASMRLVNKHAVREALDDLLGEERDSSTH
jgi:hypothetical protein